MGGAIAVEVVYARPERQVVLALRVEAGTTVRAAIEQSGLLARHPELDLARAAVGSFGRARQLDDVVNDPDRIEIYRPLLNDPKELRRRRAGRR